jgi:hypothetical protein
MTKPSNRKHAFLPVVMHIIGAVLQIPMTAINGAVPEVFGSGPAEQVLSICGQPINMLPDAYG